MRYRINGRPKSLPLVLLHGFCEDSRIWDSLMPDFKGIRTIRPDLPGFGGSDLPLAASIEAYSDAVCALLNELAVERCVLVGHSMGGYAALAFAEQYPERLAGMGLFHSNPFADSEERKTNRQRGIEQIKVGKKALYVRQLFPNLFTPTFAEAHSEVLELLIARAHRYPAEGLIAALTAMHNRPDRTEVLKTLACPVLFLLGESDGLMPVETILPAVKQVPVSDLQILEGVAHMGMFEAPEVCGPAISSFWKYCSTL